MGSRPAARRACHHADGDALRLADAAARDEAKGADALEREPKRRTEALDGEPFVDERLDDLGSCPGREREGRAEREELRALPAGLELRVVGALEQRTRFLVGTKIDQGEEACRRQRPLHRRGGRRPRERRGAIEQLQRSVEAPGGTVSHRGIVEYTQRSGTRERLHGRRYPRMRGRHQQVERLSRALVVTDAREQERVVGEHGRLGPRISGALGEVTRARRVAEPGDVVASCALDLGQRELGQRRLAA